MDGSVATGGGPWGERAWRGGGSRPGDRDISGQKNPGHIVREI